MRRPICISGSDVEQEFCLLNLMIHHGLLFPAYIASKEGSPVFANKLEPAEWWMNASHHRHPGCWVKEQSTGGPPAARCYTPPHTKMGCWCGWPAPYFFAAALRTTSACPTAV